ncbi:MAG: sulfurtransferase [Deltaproteobacteria bacterium]|nr:sulfurtransferase [Deltaproteobacteria bacterium]
MSTIYPQYLVESDWLEKHLQDPNLRILDCTVSLKPNQEGILTNVGREAWEASHIPGSLFADLSKELSDQKHSFPFMLPPAQQFEEAMSQYGIEAGKQVVLYDACKDQWAHIWAARLWWMLRVYGFDQAAILNGGLHKWTVEKRPVTKEVPTYPKANFVAKKRPTLIADKQEVLNSLSQEETCLINALSAEEHAGHKTRYGRAGRIPSSVNVPTGSLIDPKTKTYLPIENLRAQFKASGALDKDKVITYCGGGIAASSDAFILSLLGKSKVAVYDGSLLEWSADSEMPMEKDLG